MDLRHDATHHACFLSEFLRTKKVRMLNWSVVFFFFNGTFKSHQIQIVNFSYLHSLPILSYTNLFCPFRGLDIFFCFFTNSIIYWFIVRTNQCFSHATHRTNKKGQETPLSPLQSVKEQTTFHLTSSCKSWRLTWKKLSLSNNGKRTWHGEFTNFENLKYIEHFLNQK